MSDTAAKPGVFLSARWESILALHYPVEADALQPWLPEGITLDLYEGQCWMGLIGFHFRDTRVLGLRIPGHVYFPEVNLRFYVRRRVGDQWRRGVVFVRELVPRRLIAWAAKTIYNEPYAAVPMRVADTLDSAGGRLRFEWTWHGLPYSLEGTLDGEAQPCERDPAAAFFYEHYWGYNRNHGGMTMEYGVEHPSWSVHPVRDAAFHGSAETLYGPRLAPFLAGPPAYAHLATGSAVIVRRGRRLAQ